MRRLEKLDTIGIGVVGLPGSGKSFVSEVAKELGIPTIIMGDIIRNICVSKGLEPNSENTAECMINIRQKEGMDAVAKRTLPEIAKLKTNFVVIEGLRSYEEVEFYRSRLKKFIILAIHASPKTRYQRIRIRQRSDDGQDYRTFIERDNREIKAGIAKIIALADIMIVNEKDVEILKQQILNVLQQIQESNN
ncbi:MAG: AAA family ATPase [Candidatus Helarchaeota archaeon]